MSVCAPSASTPTYQSSHQVGVVLLPCSCDAPQIARKRKSMRQRGSESHPYSRLECIRACNESHKHIFSPIIALHEVSAKKERPQMPSPPPGIITCQTRNSPGRAVSCRTEEAPFSAHRSGNSHESLYGKRRSSGKSRYFGGDSLGEFRSCRPEMISRGNAVR